MSKINAYFTNACDTLWHFKIFLYRYILIYYSRSAEQLSRKTKVLYKLKAEVFYFLCSDDGKWEHISLKKQRGRGDKLC